MFLVRRIGAGSGVRAPSALREPVVEPMLRLLGCCGTLGVT